MFGFPIVVKIIQVVVGEVVFDAADEATWLIFVAFVLLVLTLNL